MKAFRSDWILESPLQITLGIDLLPAGASVRKMDQEEQKMLLEGDVENT